jgi:hypothetical protein
MVVGDALTHPVCVWFGALGMIWNDPCHVWFEGKSIVGVFSWQKILVSVTVVFLFYLAIIGLKDSSRDFTVNCAISFLFRLHLMLHACVAKFNVMFWDEKFWN